MTRLNFRGSLLGFKGNKGVVSGAHVLFGYLTNLASILRQKIPTRT